MQTQTFYDPYHTSGYIQQTLDKRGVEESAGRMEWVKTSVRGN